MVTSYGYDKDSRLTGIATRNSKQEVLDSYTYTHDKVGNRLSKMEPDAKSTYSYDAVYKLLQSMPTKLHGKDKEQEHKAETFTYDPVGNRLTGPKPKDSAFYNQGNQLVNDRKHQYEYDKNGNLIKKTEIDDDGKTKTWTYGYDYENRLIKVMRQEGVETGTTTFAYDPFGRRIGKMVTETEGGKRESKLYSYFYDNEDVIIEYLTKTEDSKTKTDVTRYLHGPGIDEPLSIERKGEIYYYHADGLGSVTALTDRKQKVVESYEYDSFGNLKRHGDKVKNAFTYTGRDWDKETGLYYYRARYYDAQAGRFTQKDPIGFAGGDVNLYGAMGGNPINRTDPDGKSWTQSIIMTGQWLFGTGPNSQTFGPGSSPVSEMKNAPGVQAARKLFYEKNAGKPCECREALTNYAAGFGLTGLFKAGLNPTQQFIGSYRVDIYPMADCKIMIILSNTSSFKSFAYGMGPDWSRSTFGPMGNMSQTYWWIE